MPKQLSPRQKRLQLFMDLRRASQAMETNKPGDRRSNRMSIPVLKPAPVFSFKDATGKVRVFSPTLFRTGPSPKRKKRQGPTKKKVTKRKPTTTAKKQRGSVKAAREQRTRKFKKITKREVDNLSAIFGHL